MKFGPQKTCEFVQPIPVNEKEARVSDNDRFKCSGVGLNSLTVAVKLENTSLAEYVAWVTRANDDERLLKWVENEYFRTDLSAGAIIEKRMIAGEPLTFDDVPKHFIAESGRRRLKPFGPISNCNSNPILSASCAEVFRAFDLGEGNLYPVKIEQSNGESLEGDYFLLNFGNVKEAIFPEGSTAIEHMFNDLYRLNTLAPKDSIVHVSAAVLGGADVWVDPKLYRAFF